MTSREQEVSHDSSLFLFESNKESEPPQGQANANPNSP